MSSQLLPVNQINALPVQTISAAVDGQVFTVGGRVTKYFNPGQLFNLQLMQSIHLPGLVDPWWYFVTPYLNLLGCYMFAFELTQKAGPHKAAPFPQMSLWMQRRLGPTDAPPLIVQDSANTPQPTISGMVELNSALTGFLASNAQGEVQRWMFTTGGDVNANGQQLALGFDQRFVIMISTGTGTSATRPTDDNLYSASLWAT